MATSLSIAAWNRLLFSRISSRLARDAEIQQRLAVAQGVRGETGEAVICPIFAIVHQWCTNTNYGQ